MNTTATPDRLDASRAALLVYDACRRALTPADPARRAAMRPVLRPQRRHGRAVPHQLRRRHAGGRLPGGDRPAARGLRAAAAEENGLTVLHDDADFDLIARVTGQPCERVVPAGSID